MVVEGKQTKLEFSVLMSDTWETQRLRTDPFPGECHHGQRMHESLSTSVERRWTYDGESCTARDQTFVFLKGGADRHHRCWRVILYFTAVASTWQTESHTMLLRNLLTLGTKYDLCVPTRNTFHVRSD